MLKVFIVDDAAVVRHALDSVLRTINGLQIIGSVGTAQEALAQIPVLAPDIVVLDIGLRDGNGIAILMELQQLTPAPGVIMLTALTRPGLKAQCLKAGARFFFDKAMEVDAFVQTLQELARANDQPTPLPGTPVT